MTMRLHAFDASSEVRLDALVSIWNAACRPDLAINKRFAQFNVRPTTGVARAGQLASVNESPIGFVLANLEDWKTFPRSMPFFGASFQAGGTLSSSNSCVIAVASPITSCCGLSAAWTVFAA